MYLKAFCILFCVNGLFISLAHFFLSFLGLCGFFFSISEVHPILAFDLWYKLHIFSLFCRLSLNFAYGRVFFCCCCCFSHARPRKHLSHQASISGGTTPFWGAHLLVVSEFPVLRTITHPFSHAHQLLHGFLGGWWGWFGSSGWQSEAGCKAPPLESGLLCGV